MLVGGRDTARWGGARAVSRPPPTMRARARAHTHTQQAHAQSAAAARAPVNETQKISPLGTVRHYQAERERERERESEIEIGDERERNRELAPTLFFETYSTLAGAAQQCCPGVAK